MLGPRWDGSRSGFRRTGIARTDEYGDALQPLQDSFVVSGSRRALVVIRFQATSLCCGWAFSIVVCPPIALVGVLFFGERVR